MLFSLGAEDNGALARRSSAQPTMMNCTANLNSPEAHARARHSASTVDAATIDEARGLLTGLVKAASKAASTHLPREGISGLLLARLDLLAKLLVLTDRHVLQELRQRRRGQIQER